MNSYGSLCSFKNSSVNPLHFPLCFCAIMFLNCDAFWDSAEISKTEKYIIRGVDFEFKPNSLRQLAKSAKKDKFKM